MQRLKTEDYPKYLEIIRKHKAAYKAKYPEQFKQRARDYQQRNKPAVLARTRARQAVKLRAIPAWADKKIIQFVYAQAHTMRQMGFDVQVDHFYPLQGKKVCGLHTHENLQIIFTEDNQRKAAKMP